MQTDRASMGTLEELLTGQEYARVRRCSVRTIERERTSGTGCRYIKLGRSVRYRRHDMWISSMAGLAKAPASPCAMTAEAIAKALGGRKSARGWTPRCPAHDDRTPSLSICDGADNKVLVHCHAGCDQERVIAMLLGRGAWAENVPRSLSRDGRRAPFERNIDHNGANRTQAAHAIWQPAKAGLCNAGRNLSRFARHAWSAA
jgi:hypothetical protein